MRYGADRPQAGGVRYGVRDGADRSQAGGVRYDACATVGALGCERKLLGRDFFDVYSSKSPLAFLIGEQRIE